MDLMSELDHLERLIQAVTASMEEMREEGARLRQEAARLREEAVRQEDLKRELEQECERLRHERSLTVGRLSHLIQKVDALREGS